MSDNAIQVDEIAKYFGMQNTKPTAVDVTDSCVPEDTQHTVSSCQKLLADFQEKLLNYQEGKLQ